jgi:DNA-binding MarR family transcriptional regulator
MSSDKKPPLEAVPRVGALLRQAWQHVRERIYAGVRADGYTDLNPAHIGLFRYPGLQGQRPTRLAEEMQITKQSVNDLLRHLESMRYVELKTDPKDHRARLIRLTTRGRRLEDAVRTHALRAEQELVEVVGKQNFEHFRDTLVRIASLSGPFPSSWRTSRLG